MAHLPLLLHSSPTILPGNWLASPNYHSRDLRPRFVLSSPIHCHSVCPWLYNRRVVDYFHHRSPNRPLCFSSIPTAGDGYEDEKQKQAAIEAVSDILQENGVSEEESLEIAVKSPKYVEMLMDSVRDLDELLQTTSSSSISTYKKKVFEMGKKKGDKGLVPLLESTVGLPLPSAMHVARYLSAHTLPNLLHKVYGEDIEFGKMLLKYPWILSTSIQKNYEEILAFLYAQKVAEVSVRHSIKSWPLLLGCSVAKLKLMIDQLHVIGVTEKTLNKITATSPQLLMQKPREFFQVVSYLKGLGLEEESVGRVLGRCPEIFMTNIDKTLRKKVEFLSELGVPKKHLPRVIRKYPEFFVCDVNNSLLPRMTYLLKIGLSKKEIAFMVAKFSPLLGYSIEEVLRPKYEFLVNTMQKPLKEVVEYPRYFSYSLEKKIKPRFYVIKGRNYECSLKDMLGKNDEEFAADYITI